MRRILAVTAATGVFAIAGAAPAFAVLDPPNTLGCHATAVIRSKSGNQVRVNATDTKIHLPREGTVAFEGGTLRPLANSHGEVAIKLGFIKVKAGSWDSPNLRLTIVVAGVKELPKALKYVPPGEYEVTGFATGSTGTCSGHITIVLSGSALSNPIGIAALGGTLLCLVGIAVAARAR